MHRIDSFIDQVVLQLQNWSGVHSLYGFAAILAVYLLSMCGRGDAAT